MKNIKYISVLAILSFLLPLVILAQAPVLSMAVQGTIKLNNVDMGIGTVLKAYCGNTTDEVGTTTLAVAGEYGPQNTSLPVNECASGTTIYVQATFDGQLTDKKATDFTFTAAEMRTYGINFTSSTGQPDTPTAPSGLTATVDSQTEITLNWVDNSTNETGFAIYKDGNLLVTADPDAVTYQATLLIAGTPYSFYVKAVNETIYSLASNTASATTLSAAESADGTTGIIVGNPLDDTQKGYVNNSTTETVVKGTKANIIADITIVGNVQSLSSITNSSADIVVAKQAIALGTASGASTSSADFNTYVVSTTGVVETIVFVPVDTTSTAAQRVAIVIPQLTLIKTSGDANLAAVEIRPPSVSDNTITENAITASFSQSTAPVSVKAAVSIPTSVSGITFKTSDDAYEQEIDICMDASNFTTSDASDVQIYYSLLDGTGWQLETASSNEAFVDDDNQFCFKVGHLTSFAIGVGETKSVICTQSGAPANASYTLANVDVTWLGSAWSTTANCSWSCDSGYTLSAGTCVAVGGGAGGGGAAPAVPTVEMPTTTTGEVTATKSGGGKTTITTDEETKATVQVPANVVSADTDVVVVPVAKTAEALTTAVAAVPSGKSLVGGYVYEITATSDGEAVTTFDKYVTITLTYKTSQITGLKESTLTINYWDEEEEEWVVLATTVYKKTNKVVAKTLHFTYFAIIGEEGVEVEVMTIAELKAKIAEILAQIKVLQAELVKLIGAPTLDVNLKYNDRGDDVELLQTWLAKDSEVYPEALVTGWFGPLTKAAVIRFQEKYASEVLAPWEITEGTGFVGSTTRDKLNALYSGQ